MKNIVVFILLSFYLSSQGQEAIKPIDVTISGKGDPILLIPGFTVPGDAWEETVKHLESNYECHVVTLAGFGGLEPIEFPWLPKVNQALESYIKDNKLNEVTVIGHSLGGTIATWLASREHHRIKRIILVDALPAAGALMIPNYDPKALAYESPFNTQQLSMSPENFEQMATGMSQGMSLNKEAQNKIKDWIINSDRKTYVYGYTDYLKLDMREDLKHISIPVSIIAAEQPFGKTMVTQTYSDQYSKLSKFDLIIAENAAHFVMFDKPEWFNDQILQILASN